MSAAPAMANVKLNAILKHLQHHICNIHQDVATTLKSMSMVPILAGVVASQRYNTCL